ncbi:MAG: phosphoenolpyruvate carboxylase, partial [Candidatus Thermoplasmatota archaeon]|nr:phosphoenolpyruvate carboxylase [Candidatus Thermoplasmatota archaeon]
NQFLPKTEPILLTDVERTGLKRINKRFEQIYQKTIFSISDTINEVAAYVPSRRERRLHIGLLGYGRSVKSKSLPRAITFTAALYSLGIPPELIGTGRGIREMSAKDLSLLEKHYITLEDDLCHAGQYLNKENIHLLADKVSGIRNIMKDIEALESYLGTRLGPRSSQSYIHRNWTSTLFFQQKQKEDMSVAVLESAKIRKSLG